ncbi:MAG TPA: response regulator [Thermoanaerobaculia bacterium]|nr:response regulator [Thermoanaerobaculia bacterium]
MEARVLVADDDQSIRQLLGTIIRREQVRVDLAADGREAIDLLEQHEYPVILLDLMMPNVDGFEVVSWLKANPPVHKPVIIVITAYADQKFKDVDSELVAGVLRKPFDVGEVGSLVQACVRGFRTALASSVVETDETVRSLSADALAHLQTLRAGSGSRH